MAKQQNRTKSMQRKYFGSWLFNSFVLSGIGRQNGCQGFLIIRFEQAWQSIVRHDRRCTLCLLRARNLASGFVLHDRELPTLKRFAAAKNQLSRRTVSIPFASSLSYLSGFVQ